MKLHQAWNWDTIPKEQLSDGVVRQMAYGDALMICRLTIGARNRDHAARSHSRTDDDRREGPRPFRARRREQTFGPGDILHFPSGFWHGATMLDEEVVLLDIFTPRREDFLKAPETSM